MRNKVWVNFIIAFCKINSIFNYLSKAFLIFSLRLIFECIIKVILGYFDEGVPQNVYKHHKKMRV